MRSHTMCLLSTLAMGASVLSVSATGHGGQLNTARSRRDTRQVGPLQRLGTAGFLAASLGPHIVGADTADTYYSISSTASGFAASPYVAAQVAVAYPRTILDFDANNMSEPEKEAHDEVQKEVKDLLGMSAQAVALAKDLEVLREFKIELGLLISLPKEDKDEIVSLLKAKQFQKALQAVIKDQEHLPLPARMDPKVPQLFELLTKIDSDVTAFEQDATMSLVQLEQVQKALQKWYAEDLAPGELHDLVDQLVAALKGLVADSAHVGAQGKRAVESLKAFVEKTMKERKFDDQDFDLFEGEAKDVEASIKEKVVPDAQLVAQKAATLAVKLEELLQPEDGFVV